MKILLGTSGIPHSTSKKTSADGVRRISELGLSAMEIEFVRGVHMSLETAKNLGKVAEDAGVSLSVHAPYYINFASETPRIIEESKKRVMDSLERGVAMGASVVVVHAGYYGKDKAASSQMVFDTCRDIDAAIEQKGLGIKLALETMGRQKSWGTVDDILAVCSRLKHVVPCIDAAHLYALGAGHVDFARVFDKLKVLNLRGYHSHFSGIRYTIAKIGSGNERDHVPLSVSGPNFERYAKEILKRNLDMTIICESPLLEMDSLLMKETLENLGYKF